MNGTGATRVCGVHGTALQLPSLAALTFGYPPEGFATDDEDNDEPQPGSLYESYFTMMLSGVSPPSDASRDLMHEASNKFGLNTKFYDDLSNDYDSALREVRDFL